MGREPLMFAHVRWQPVPRLLLLAALALGPALTLWSAAIGEALGIGRPLSQLASVLPTSRGPHFAGFVILHGLTLVGPLMAGALSALALVEAELHLEDWEISGRVRLPAPPWRPVHLVAGLLLGLGGLLFCMAAGYLAADCLFGGDCPRV
jgi:hypothetical protein